METNEIKNVNIKNFTCYYFDGIIKIEDYEFDKNHTKIFWIMTFHTKLCLAQTSCVLNLIKWMDLLEFMMRLDLKYYLVLKNMMPFRMKLDVLLAKKNGITFAAKKHVILMQKLKLALMIL